jgi:hypothetical protein
MSKQNRRNKKFDVYINLVYRYIFEFLGIFEYFKQRLGRYLLRKISKDSTNTNALSMVTKKEKLLPVNFALILI